MDSNIPVFRLSESSLVRTAERGRDRTPIATSWPSSAFPSVPVRCITVDSPSRLYLAGEEPNRYA